MAAEMLTWPSEEQKKKVLLARLSPEERSIYDTVRDIRRCREASSQAACTDKCEYVTQDQTCQYKPSELSDWASIQVYWYANDGAYDELRLLLFLCHLSKLPRPLHSEQEKIVELSKRILDKAEDAEDIANIALEPLAGLMKDRSPRRRVDVESQLSNHHPMLLEAYRYATTKLGESEVKGVVSALDAGAELSTVVNKHLRARTARAEGRLSPPYRGVPTVTILIVTVVVAWAVASFLPAAAMPLAALVSFVNIALLDSMFRPSSFDPRPMRRHE